MKNFIIATVALVSSAGCVHPKREVGWMQPLSVRPDDATPRLAGAEIRAYAQTCNDCGVDPDTDFWLGLVRRGGDEPIVAVRGGRGGPNDGTTVVFYLQLQEQIPKTDVEAGATFLKVHWEPHGSDNYAGQLTLILTYTDGSRVKYDFGVRFGANAYYPFDVRGPGQNI